MQRVGWIGTSGFSGEGARGSCGHGQALRSRGEERNQRIPRAKEERPGAISGGAEAGARVVVVVESSSGGGGSKGGGGGSEERRANKKQKDQPGSGLSPAGKGKKPCSMCKRIWRLHAWCFGLLTRATCSFSRSPLFSLHFLDRTPRDRALYVQPERLALDPSLAKCRLSAPQPTTPPNVLFIAGAVLSHLTLLPQAPSHIRHLVGNNAVVVPLSSKTGSIPSTITHHPFSLIY